MITKIPRIKNLAVFQDLDWDRDVKNKDNSIAYFKKVNIIYGRNYTGKTTISRIFRALETGILSDKYDNPECSINIRNESNVDQTDFSAHSKTVRVFNDDFIKESLKFIADPEQNINSFAILGTGNNVIEREIELINDKLGSNEEGNETNLYKEKNELAKREQELKTNYDQAILSFDTKLKKKAIDNPSGIKYQMDKYGDQNYTITKLRREIEIVTKDNYTSLSETEVESNLNIVKDIIKDDIDALPELELSFKDISIKVKELVEKPISKTGKIDELLKNAIRNKWVSEGYKLHNQYLEICLFCDNPISEFRWKKLEDHFDEQSKNLEDNINSLLIEIEKEIQKLNRGIGLKKSQFYSKYQDDLDHLSEKYIEHLNDYNEGLKSLTSQLLLRKKDILNEIVFEEVSNVSYDLLKCRSTLDNLSAMSNIYSKNLSGEKEKASKNLRYNTVYDFVIDNDYSNSVRSLDGMKNNFESAHKATETKVAEILELEKQVNEKQRLLKDEGEGAKKVNEYFNNYFGNHYLELAAIEEEDEDLQATRYRFEVQRDGRKAYHLSDGESRLLAFCYFMAKLNDVDTKGKKPIIWIDDPISSLDSNHIFFVYSLINNLIKGNDFEQIFISTHNLDFLKYLKKVPNDNRAYFIIQRKDKFSKIMVMPDFMKKFVTEFNYLFKQVYLCSTLTEVSDENYTSFYNFGNNARKFLEIYLHYKFPDSTPESEKLRRFFGDENIPAVLTDRINNEYSHLCGIFERGANVIEVPEMNSAACLIINKIKEGDINQYNSLLNSIGITAHIDEEE